MGCLFRLIIWKNYLRFFEESLIYPVFSVSVFNFLKAVASGILWMKIWFQAVLSGIIKQYPVYWINLFSAVLFLGFIWLNFPLRERVMEIIRNRFGDYKIVSWFSLKRESMINVSYLWLCKFSIDIIFKFNYWRKYRWKKKSLLYYLCYGYCSL